MLSTTVESARGLRTGITAQGGQIAGNHHELQACKLLTLWITLVDKFGKTKNVRCVAGQGVLQGAGRGHQGRGTARVSAGGDADGAEADQEGKN